MPGRRALKSSVKVYKQFAYFINPQTQWGCAFTSVSGSVFLHTRSAAELRRVVDVKLDAAWRKKKKDETDERRERP